MQLIFVRSFSSQCQATEDEEDEKPKAKRGATKKAPGKTVAKKRTSKKADEDESGEDFGAAIDAVSGDEDDEEEPAPKAKRKVC